MGYLPRQFDKGFERAVHFCKICLLQPYHRAKGTLVFVIANLRQETEMDQNFLEGITGDEKLVYGCDPETKHQSLYWKSPESPRLKKAHHVCSKVKLILMFF
jgi:hypothetical protein